METAHLHANAQAVQQALESRGLQLTVREYPSSTRTAQEAADSIGCDVGQIAKSLVFRGASSGEAYLLIVSGSRRVNEALVSAAIGEPLEKANADFVREKTGFPIGGVPPLGHATQLKIYIDTGLQMYQEIWAAAGTPNAVFRLSWDELLKATDGVVLHVA